MQQILKLYFVLGTVSPLEPLYFTFHGVSSDILYTEEEAITKLRAASVPSLFDIACSWSQGQWSYFPLSFFLARVYHALRLTVNTSGL